LFHDIIQIFQKTLIGGCQNGQAVFRFSSKGFWSVDPTLVEDGIDGREEEFRNDSDGSFECNDCFGISDGSGHVGMHACILNELID
jgi:hypothetical protein